MIDVLFILLTVSVFTLMALLVGFLDRRGDATDGSR